MDVPCDDNPLTTYSFAVGGIIITPELYWTEADFVHNLTVVGNTVANTGYGLQGYGGIALGAFTNANALVPATGHTGVVIANNTLLDVHYAPLWLSSAADVLLANNSIVRPFSGPSNPTCCEALPQHVVALAAQLANLTAVGNCVYAPGAPTAGVFNVTEVSGDFAGGVALCG
jgi:hypothetical protein